MTDAEKIEKEQRAVAHVLNRIREDEGTRRQIGFGTQSFELLTEAAAALFDEPVEGVREHFGGITGQPPKSVDEDPRRRHAADIGMTSVL
jgi:hypothetical protein